MPYNPDEPRDERGRWGDGGGPRARDLRGARDPRGSNHERAVEVASNITVNSDRYQSWTACAKMLFGRGYEERGTTAILRSKITRWAADASDKPYGRSTARDLAKYMDANPRIVAQVLAEDPGD